MINFFKAIKQRGRFTPDDLAAVEAIVTEVTIVSGDDVLRAGEVSSTLFFLRSGSMLRSRKNDDGELVVDDLFVANDWVLDHNSFTGRSPALCNITAQTDSQLLALKIEDIHELIAASPAFFQLGSILQMGTARQELFDKYVSPEERYRFVLEQRPELLHSFPLKFIASFLKMTPETLSRVRKRISGG